MDENKISVLKAAYEAHKNELMQRHKMDTTAGAATILFFLLSFRVISLYPPAAGVLSSLTIKCAGTIIFVMITDVAVYFMLKNYNKICELQRIIARIDVAFGFFDKDAHLPGESLYPVEWKKFGARRSWSAFTRAALPIVLCAMVIALLWFKQF